MTRVRRATRSFTIGKGSGRVVDGQRLAGSRELEDPLGWRSLDGGTAWASSPVLRKWAATQVTETMSLDTHEKFKRLRLLRAFAEQVGERELETTIRGFVGWARLDLLGQQGGEPERRVVCRVLEWATAAVEIRPLLNR